MKVQAPSRQEEVALFRLGIVGDLLSRELARGELEAALKERAVKHRYRPPGASRTRTFSWKTLQRWYYAAKSGTHHLEPRSRRKGFAKRLAPDQKQLLLDTRRAFPSASAELILSEAVRNGVVEEHQVSLSTLRRLFRQAGLTREALSVRARQKARRRWQAQKPGMLWHADVCHLKLRRTDGSEWHVCVHAILDDCSRAVMAIDGVPTEREEDLLLVLVGALLKHPRPSIFFVDNGSCYRGHVLAHACQRLGIRLVHAQPYDPEARGKMERFWRSMRQGCTDHFGAVDDLGTVRTALWAWVDHRYHRRPHGGLMGATPMQAWRAGARDLPAPLAAREIAHALEVTLQRRVAADGTFSLEGRLYEVAGSHLAGRSLDVVLDPLTGTLLGVRADGREVPVGLCDPRANSRRSRPGPSAAPAPANLPFHPIAALLAAARKEPSDV